MREMTLEQVRLLIARDIARVERLLIPEVIRALTRVREKTIPFVRVGNLPVGWEARLQSELAPLMTDAMLTLDFIGQRRSYLFANAYKSQELELSVFSALQDKLKSFTNVTQQVYDRMRFRYAAKAAEDVAELAANVREKLTNFIRITKPASKDELEREFDKIGVSPRNITSVTNVITTQTQTAYNVGRWRADQTPEIKDKLWGYEYHTMRDEKVREDHRGLEGTTLPYADIFWQVYWPPNGWGCRCLVLPRFTASKLVLPRTSVLPPSQFRFNAGPLIAI